MPSKYFKLTFKSNLLYIGERIKKGTFKPSIFPTFYRYKKGNYVGEIMSLPIPYSTITGAIESILGENKEINAIGKIIKYEKGYMSVAPYDIALGTSKLPITIEYLSNVQGEIFIKKTNDFYSLSILDSMEGKLYLGGLKSKGFGKCEIISGIELDHRIIKGEGAFISRIYDDDNVLRQFGISRENIIKPYYGYLFRKTSRFNGYYQKSIYENTIIKECYNFLVEVIK